MARILVGLGMGLCSTESGEDRRWDLTRVG
jgi:hypothetical protein